MSQRSRVQVPPLLARLAQLVERKTFNLVVVGSSPTAGIFIMKKGLCPISSIAQLAERSAVNR